MTNIFWNGFWFGLGLSAAGLIVSIIVVLGAILIIEYIDRY